MSCNDFPRSSACSPPLSRAARRVGGPRQVHRSPDPRVRADPGRGLRPRPAPGHPGPAQQNRYGGGLQAPLTPGGDPSRRRSIDGPRCGLVATGLHLDQASRRDVAVRCGELIHLSCWPGKARSIPTRLPVRSRKSPCLDVTPTPGIPAPLESLTVPLRHPAQAVGYQRSRGRIRICGGGAATGSAQLDARRRASPRRRTGRAGS
jgi:hypothetical protein